MHLINLSFIIRIFVLSVCFCHFADAIAEEKDVLVKKVNFGENKKLEISLSKKADFKIFTLSNPDRLIVDLKNTELSEDFQQQKFSPLVKNFRYSKNENDLRLVFELKEKSIPKNTSFNDKNKIISSEIINIQNAKESATQTKEEPKTAKLIIEKNGNVVRKFTLKNQNNSQKKESSISNSINQEKSLDHFLLEKELTENNKNSKQVAEEKDKNQGTTNLVKNFSRSPIIVVDAGHGGKDPGTIGIYARSKEKNLTLSYARELVKNLKKNKKYKVFLTRDSDEFLPLQKRVEIARHKKADLFISLHANSTSDPDISGFSIYTLSETSSDKRAELLAQKENQADIINGIDFSGASRDVMKTLIDLSQRESKNSSANFAKFVIDEMKKSEVEILQNTHRFAGFMVLTAPDMSSVLIELGYLSNKNEEKKMSSVSYKRLITKSLTNAVDQYFINFK